MVKLEDILVKDNCTSEYLEKNCQIAKTSMNDLGEIALIIANCFNIPRMFNSRLEDVIKFVSDTKLDIDNCVKLYDPSTNKIYGILMVGNKKLH